ncbi:patatin-like phospholipase family protein [uncultured Vagococcus sp.]|uniref:patatin-like phospholipase family protein n=1 Tax=uncultured Vagococcus sp. TaxID=189676 RepID=UPI0028D1AE33|nr:patatin-like phospholipase family protein [uncultured Vagococcus sp.]
MKIVRLNDGNKRELAGVIQQYTQLLPFFATNSEARQTFIESFSKGSHRHVGIEKSGRLVGVASYLQEGRSLAFKSFLLKQSPGSNQLVKGMSFWLKQLEKIGKLARTKRIILQLATTNVLLEGSLKTLDYQLDDNLANCWQKPLYYKTGLVLAGGGARGAYQIGAWRALKELGIEFELIAGTSVGALNGGLILQDDLASAEKMWSQIDTGKILTFPGMSLDKRFSVNAVLRDMQHFAMSAVTTQGVSTKPLQQLIQTLLDEATMAEKSQDLFLCTTQLPQMKEVVVSFKATPRGTFHQWLLASSSFFPAMEATRIDDKYYVDGGYRNNIPVDVALQQGATELIVIDVKGPGITKPVHVPDSLPLITVASPWSLGTVLLFDGARSQWNIRLGYLETLKAFGRYIGHWYTFNHQVGDKDVKTWQRKFSRGVIGGMTEEERQMLNGPKFMSDWQNKLRQVYQEVSTAMMPLYVLEICAKILGVSPIECYTIEGMLDLIKEKIAGNWLTDKPEEGMLLSLQEWLRLYADELPLPTDKQQVIFFYYQLKKTPDQLVLSAANLAPTVYLVAKLLIWLEEKEME